MFRRVTTWVKCWFRKSNNYKASRVKSSDHAVCTAERLINSGALQNGRMTGNPLVRG